MRSVIFAYRQTSMPGHYAIYEWCGETVWLATDDLMFGLRQPFFFPSISAPYGEPCLLLSLVSERISRQMAAEVKGEYLNLFIKIKETGVLLNALFVTNSAHSFLCVSIFFSENVYHAFFLQIRVNAWKKVLLLKPSDGLTRITTKIAAHQYADCNMKSYCLREILHLVCHFVFIIIIIIFLFLILTPRHCSKRDNMCAFLNGLCRQRP